MAEQLIEQKLESLRRCVGRVQERIPAISEALADDPDSSTNSDSSPAISQRLRA